jgi:NADH-quinone oxidoreductase subunit F
LDLRLLETPATAAERAPVDAVLGAPDPDASATTGLADAKKRRHLLLPALHAVQARFGWIPPGALGYCCERLHVPPAEAWGVATFYALFAVHERPPLVAHVCDDIACKTRGADALCASLTAALGPAGTPVQDGAATWHRSPCLGMCEQAPAALLVAAGDAPVEGAIPAASSESVQLAIATRSAPVRGPAPIPQRDVPGAPAVKLLARVGVVDPTRLDDYRAHGGYAALRRALELGPAGVIREVTESGLVGRGGAAFPTGKKWEAVAKNPVSPRWLVCNADESEPGTFKDRVLMEEDPFSVVEAMTIAGIAVGAARGILYVRAEYPLAAARIAGAVAAARARGLLGDDVMGRGHDFDIDVRRGAGAYICGEETALFNSIEGFRGEPRSKPPFPVDKGLFGLPTVVNNVETLVNVLPILLEGAAQYRSVGTAGSPGTRLFCLSGAVQRPGLYEVPFGMRLDELIGLAGGLPDGRRMQAVLLGGAAGVFVGPNELGLPLTFEDTRKAGATLGSGVVMVVDDTVPLADLLVRIAAFFRDESCGQCVPCRVGTVRQEELLARLAAGRPHRSLETERALLAELGQAMRDASICGLGQTASSAIESALVKLPVLGVRP